MFKITETPCFELHALDVDQSQGNYRWALF